VRRAVALGAAAAGTALAGAYVGSVTGRLTLDLGVGRRTRRLGPIVVDVAAPPEIVYAVAAAPYAERRSRALRQKVEILERAGDMVLAEHRTPVGLGLVARTVETVVLEPVERIRFRLVRGPVPHVLETFTFEAVGAGTRLSYTGELGTDLGPAGAAWGALVARSWVAAVERSLAAIRAEGERRVTDGPAG